jgi:hypothetical protein
MKKIKKIKHGVDGMVVCPLCHSFMYPLALENPKDIKEQNVIVCASCKKDIAPFLEFDILLRALEEADKEYEEAKVSLEES